MSGRRRQRRSAGGGNAAGARRGVRARSTHPRSSGSGLGRAARMERIIERDGPTCVWCGRGVGPGDARGLVELTTEHVVPRIKGGPSWIENEVAACKRCNGRRGHRTPAEWAAECEGFGWSPDRERLVRVLSELEARIAEVGGQRRARPYVASQLRRLRNTT